MWAPAPYRALPLSTDLAIGTVVLSADPAAVTLVADAARIELYWED